MSMVAKNQSSQLVTTRNRVAAKVRELRKARGLSQAALARELGLSQNRLSEIERGFGSFTAEQFLTILRTFNVAVSDFVPSVGSPESELQNALARLGASHLQESERSFPSERLESVHDVIREALVSGRPRLIAAIGPVLVSNADTVNLWRLDQQLAATGLERRLRWVVGNVLEVLRRQRAAAPGAAWARAYRRAIVVLANYLAQQQRPDDDVVWDVLDQDIRDERSLEQVKGASKKVSTDWRIVSSLQYEDFKRALKEQRAHD